MEKQLGIVHISRELLERWLNLGNDHRVVDVFIGNSDKQRNVISVVISGPKLAYVPEGECMPYIPFKQLNEIINRDS